jgi:preprotein translocase subunit SecB
MNIAPLQVKHYFIESFQITAIKAFDRKKAVKNIEDILKSDTKYLVNKTNPKSWQVQLNILLKPDISDNIPYEFNLSLVGFFEIDDPKQKDIVYINAPAMLYSAAREIIASITGRGPWGSVILPSINFLPIPNK